VLYSFGMRPEAFVGRRAEIAQARELLERVAAGRGGALVVVGESGIGKTRLLDEIARLASPSEFLFARAECLPLSTPLPFEAVLELLRVLHRSRREDVSIAAASTAGSGLFTAVVGAIERVAAERPVLLMLDDLQLSDAATRELVHYCIARLADLPVGWVLATRPGREVEALIHHLTRSRLAGMLELRGLTQEELRELIAAWLDAESADDDLAAAIHERSEGNVFFAEELVRMLEEQGKLISTGGVALAEPLDGLVPPSVAQAVRERVGRLPSEARNVLAWASLLPEPIDPALLSDVVGSRVDVEASTLADATLLREEPAGWRFVHAMVREAVYAGFPRGERARRHSAVADALAPTDAVRRAPQLAAAGRTAEAAAAYLELAEGALVRGGAEDADVLYRRAAGLAVEAVEAVLRRKAESGVVLALLRRGKSPAARARAEALLKELRRTGTASERLEFLSRYAVALWNDAGDMDAARAAIDEAEPLLDGASGSRQFAEAAAARAHILDRGGDPIAALPFAERALEAARASEDRLLEARALNCLGLVVGETRDARAGMAIVQEAAELGAAEGLPEEEALAYLRLSYLSEVCGDEDGHEAYARQGLTVPNLSPALEALLRGNVAASSMKQGRLDSALAFLLSARRAAQRAGGKTDERVALQLVLVQIARGELTDAESVLSGLKPSRGSWEHRRTLMAWGDLLEERGEHSGALRYFLAAANGESPSSIWCLAGVARNAARVGDRDAARTALGRMEELASRWPVANWLVPSARAAVAEAEGRPDEACALLEQAAATCEGALERTRFELDVARLRCDREAIVAAIEAYESMGARHAADRARAVARSLGMRPGRHRSDRGVLTGREQEIAYLVAAGKTNAEIAQSLWISPRTVERHVGSLLGKLGYRSRVELAAAVAAGELPGSGLPTPARAQGAV
jgi:DNA-binding CsgD family transcriptional regulator